MANPITTQEAISTFIEYHRKRRYKIFESFPMITDDPTVMFVNATITPFKRFFTDSSVIPENFALIQRCFRLGNNNEIELIRTNPFLLTFFEMCGSGIFGVNHEKAVEYALDLIETLGLNRKSLLFTIPDDQKFKNALIVNDINREKIFTITTNGTFWQSWRFGKMGPIGKGLTAIYSSSQEKTSLEKMISNPDLYIDLLNLIYIYGQETKDGQIVPISHPGFELGMGLERLVAILQNSDSYYIDSIKPLMEKVSIFAEKQNLEIDITTTRILTNHLRSICVLIDENVVPSNKKHGYALRRIVRHFLETIWSMAGCVIPVEKLIMVSVDELRICGLVIRTPASVVCDTINKESQALQKIMKETKVIIKRQPNITTEVLKDTYGLSPTLLQIMKGGSHESD